MVRTFGKVEFETKKQQRARACRLAQGTNKKRSKDKEELRNLCGRVDENQAAMVRNYSRTR